MQDGDDPYVFIRLGVIPMGYEDEPPHDLEDAEVFHMCEWHFGTTWIPLSKLATIGICHGVWHTGACHSETCYFASYRNGSTRVPKSRWGKVWCNDNMDLHFVGPGRCVEERREMGSMLEEEQAKEDECRKWVKEDLWDEGNMKEQLLKEMESMKIEPCLEDDKALKQEQLEEVKKSKEEQLEKTNHGKMVEVSSLKQLQDLRPPKKRKTPAKKAPENSITKRTKKNPPRKRQMPTELPTSDDV